MSIYGELDTATECLKRVVDVIVSEWKSGKVRYRSEDIKRARKYLKEINRRSRDISKTLKSFESVV